MNRKKYQKLWREKHKEYRKKNNKMWQENNPEKVRRKNKKWQEKNPDYNKNWRKKNRDKIKIYGKMWRDKHKEERRRYDKNYREKNREKIRKYIKNKKKLDINFKISEILRSRIWNVLKGKYKSAKTLELLGCTISQLKKHLERKFKRGMNWKNYGKKGWHIDHKIPCCEFNLSKTNEQLQCFNYRNLQPLWAKDNLRKAKRRRQ